MLIAVPVVYGGIRWSGFDPQVQIGGTQYNVTVIAPESAWCDVSGPIDVTFYVAPGSEYVVDSESTGGSGDCAVETKTTFVETARADGRVGLEVLVSSDKKGRDKGKGRFPVKLEVVVDEGGDEAVTYCNGSSNKPVRCWIDDADEGGNTSASESKDKGKGKGRSKR